MGLANKSHSGWGFVFPIILKNCPGDPDLISLGRAFINTVSGKHGSWAAVWKSLWDHGDDQIFLGPIGLTWMNTVGRSHGGFSFVCERLWLQDPKDTDLRLIGITWLKSHMNDSTWYFFWNKMIKIHPGDTDLLDIGYLFLSKTSRKKKLWAMVWRSLRSNGGDHDSLDTIGFEWLKGDGQHLAGFNMLELFLDTHPKDMGLLDVASRYLNKVDPSNWQWPILWRKLTDAGLENEDILRLGRDWLNKYPIDQTGWGRVWGYLASHGNPDHELLSRGWQWMDAKFFRRASWLGVWEVLWERDVGQRHRLAELVVDWVQYKKGRPEDITKWEEVCAFLPKSPMIPTDS